MARLSTCSCFLSFSPLPVCPFWDTFYFPQTELLKTCQVTVKILFKKKKVIFVLFGTSYKSCQCLQLPLSQVCSWRQQRWHQVYTPPPGQCLGGTSQKGSPLCAEKASLGCSPTLNPAPAWLASR